MVGHAQPVDRYVTVNNLRFHYREIGSPDHPLLVILHGLNSHSWDWDFLALALCDRYHVVVPDQRGHGETEWAEDYTFPRFKEDIDGLLTHLGVERFTLLGYSVGGAVAFSYAGTYPSRIVRLVIVDNSPAPNFRRPPELQEMLRQLQSQADFADPEEAVALWARYDPRARIEAIRHTVTRNLRRSNDGRWLWRDDPHSRANGGSATLGSYAPSREERWELIAKIVCPTLLVYGIDSEQDHSAGMQRMSELIPDCRVVGIDATHRVHWDNPQALTAAVRDFLM
jgi:pimeloyl-ACP methyl ester carboxylesterase